MGWFDYHDREFAIGGQTYGLPVEEEWAIPPRINAVKIRLRDGCKPRKTRINYLYDMKDSWGHRLVIAKLRPGDSGP